MHLIVLIVLTLVFVYLSYLLNNRLNYFKNRNIPYLKSLPLAGVFADVFIGRKGLYDCIQDIYNNPKLKNEKFFGVFLFHKPALFINDPEIIKQILVRDFNSFSNHIGGSDVHDPLGTSSLLFAKDSLWRNLRRKLTPFFSSVKLKSMFSVLDKTSDNLVHHIEGLSSGKNSVEIKIKEKLLLYTSDVIATCAFGIDANGIKNPAGEFPQLAKKMFNFSTHRGLEFTAHVMLPEITKLFNFKVFTNEGSEFLKKSLTYVMSEREKSKLSRNDLIDTLIEIKNSEMKNNEEQPLSMDQLIAQAAIFYSAGYETSSGASSFLFYELSKNQEIQDRVRKEIQAAVVKNDGKITFEVVMHDTPYLHQVLLETFRIYPVLPFLDRQCTNVNGYSMEPFSDFVVPYKMPIFIPVFGIQRDEKYFPEPLKFDPERFLPENIHNVPAFTVFPFGGGNRACIGERFGLMVTKTAVIKILMNYRVEMTDATPTEIKLAKNAFIVQSDVPLVLRLVKDKLEI